MPKTLRSNAAVTEPNCASRDCVRQAASQTVAASTELSNAVSTAASVVAAGLDAHALSAIKSGRTPRIISAQLISLYIVAMRWSLVVALLGCAAGEEDAISPMADASTDSRSSAGDSASFVTDGATDGLSDGAIEAIFGLEDTAPPKICETPTGTTVTASGSYGSTPDMAADRNLGSVWNSGDYSGWVRLKFPKPIYFDRVRVAANALPACSEPYVLSAGAPIGNDTRPVSESVAWLEPFTVTAGTYEELMIQVGPALSWITLAEVQVFDSSGGCATP